MLSIFQVVNIFKININKKINFFNSKKKKKQFMKDIVKMNLITVRHLHQEAIVS